jgi:F-type H+-transporting ATPase subunit b
LEGLGINPGLLIIQILAFIIVLLTLNAWVYKPLMETLHKRRETIAKGLQDASVAAEARADAERAAAKIVADAQAEAGNIVREATERAVAAARDVQAAAEAEAAKIRGSAQQEAEVERNRILGDLRGQVAALAVAAAQRLIGESLDEQRQHALVEQFFSGVDSGRLVVLDGEDFRGESAEVTSALPLTEQEQDALKRNVLKRAGAQAVTFHVDPMILGGLVIRIGNKVLDDSVSGKLEGLRQNLR